MNVPLETSKPFGTSRTHRSRKAEIASRRAVLAPARAPGGRPVDVVGSWDVEFVRQGHGSKKPSKDAEPTARWQSTCQQSWAGWTGANAPKRRDGLRDLCRCIDFRRIDLLDDTVTELLIARGVGGDQKKQLHLKTPLSNDSEYAPFAEDLWFRIREDPLRVRFPICSDTERAPTMEWAILQRHSDEDLGDGVYRVRLRDDGHNDNNNGKGIGNLYVCKEINRQIYRPRDTDVLEREMQNLLRLRDAGTNANIVRLHALLVSRNPYQTVSGDDVGGAVHLRGILLEYHPNGTLKDALASPNAEMRHRWRVWAGQIAAAMDCLHEHGITHMDIKPSNVVISNEWDAILIDISGIGGVTREWLSPPFLDDVDPLARSWVERVQNDIWALGKMLSAMASVLGNTKEHDALQSIVGDAMGGRPDFCLRDVSLRLHADENEKK
ncbi:Protein kinase-like domain protein [Niveomyces insectorum RCEF 264]|uniref:Protein kinase-like domain protein n=1 Tax=Niveomyces insectorum RCEF 264 TaxID=1081102 RepID=A0A167LWB8_9HYPO|nr:Protein kinase-like domain protein [Niveomyces insectorum RCEF 264]